ncbi:MAG: hypothetical protein O9264_03025 [Leptospira sp.]|nr:hypothetical protein [Leptospira sp.]
MKLRVANLIIVIFVTSCFTPDYWRYSRNWNLVNGVSNECLLKSSIDDKYNLINAYLLDEDSTNQLIEYFKLKSNTASDKWSYVVEIYSNENFEEYSHKLIGKSILLYEKYQVEKDKIQSFGIPWTRINNIPMRLKENELSREPDFLAKILSLEKRDTYVTYLIYINIDKNDFLKNESEVVRQTFNASSFDNHECFKKKGLNN